MRNAPERSARNRVAIWTVSLALLGSHLGVVASRGFAAEPWKPTGELARVKFDKDCALILLPVTVNGEAHHFFLDTCCTTTQVDTTLAVELRQLSTSRVQTEGGEIQVPRYSAPRVAIADIVCDQISEVGAIDLTPFRTAVGKNFRGIVGMDFLRSMILHIDYDNGLVILCDAKTDSQPPGAGTPLILDGILQPKILVRPRGVDAVVFRIDTGFTGTGRFDSDLTNLLRRAKGVATTRITDEALLANGAVERVAFERCLELEVAGHRHADLIVSQGKANTLGLGFLRRHRVTLDFVNQKAYFEPGKDFSLRDRRDYDGIVVDHEMVVQGVVPGSVAEKAGLKVSDRLVAVGPTKATVAQWPTIRDLLTTPRATSLVITVERDGQELAISIPGG